MLDYSDAFDKFYKKEKQIGRFELRTSEPNSGGIFGRQKERSVRWINKAITAPNYVRRAPIVYFDYLDCFALNACASKFDSGVYFIAIFKGAVLLIYDLFLRFLSNPKILTHIGNAQLELSDSEPYPYQIVDFLHLLRKPDVNSVVHLSKNPIDRIRHIYSLHLINLALDFVTAHEMGHILYGHVDYSRELTFSNSILEHELIFILENNIEVDLQ